MIVNEVHMISMDLQVHKVLAVRRAGLIHLVFLVLTLDLVILEIYLIRSFQAGLARIKEDLGEEKIYKYV